MLETTYLLNEKFYIWIINNQCILLSLSLQFDKLVKKMLKLLEIFAKAKMKNKRRMGWGLNLYQFVLFCFKAQKNADNNKLLFGKGLSVGPLWWLRHSDEPCCPERWDGVILGLVLSLFCFAVNGWIGNILLAFCCFLCYLCCAPLLCLEANIGWWCLLGVLAAVK